MAVVVTEQSDVVQCCRFVGAMRACMAVVVAEQSDVAQVSGFVVVA